MNIKEIFNNMNEQEKAQMLEYFAKEQEQKEKDKKYANKKRLINILQNKQNYEICYTLEKTFNKLNEEIDDLHIELIELDAITIKDKNIVGNKVQTYIRIYQDAYQGIYDFASFFNDPNGLFCSIQENEEKEAEIINEILTQLQKYIL